MNKGSPSIEVATTEIYIISNPELVNVVNNNFLSKSVFIIFSFQRVPQNLLPSLI